jgi:hypothetical protein
MNYYDPATKKQLGMISFLLDKINMREQTQRQGLVISLGNNTFKLADMTVEQANSVIWKLQYITAKTFDPTKEETA